MKKLVWIVILLAAAYLVYRYYPQMKEWGSSGSAGMDKVNNRVDRTGIPLGN